MDKGTVKGFKYQVQNIKPYKHQIDGARMIFENFKKNQGCALFFEPGTGKTLSAFMGAIAYTKKFLKNGRTLVITAPFLKEDFHCKIKTYSPFINSCVIDSTYNNKTMFVQSSKEDPFKEAEPLRLTSDPRKALVVLEKGEYILKSQKNKNKFPLTFKGDDPIVSDFVVVSYNLLKERVPYLEHLGVECKICKKTNSKYNTLGDIIVELMGIDCIIADESQKIKDPESTATKIVLDISKKVPTVVMTGTPVGNGLQDLWSQYRISSIEGIDENFNKFSRKHFVFGGFKNRQIIDVKTSSRDKILSLGKNSQVMAVLTKDVTNIPDEINIEHVFKLSEEWMKTYKDYEKNLLLDIEGYETIESSSELSLKLYLQSFTSGLIPQTGVYDVENMKKGKNKFVQVNEDKLKEFHKVYIEHVKKDNKRCIVWYRFSESRRTIEEYFSKINIKFESLYGGMKETVTEKVSRWRKDLESKVLIAQISINAGYDANEAEVNIIYEPTFSFLDDKQSRGRTQRIGQKNSVKYIYMVAENTIDEKIIKKLDKKRKESKGVFSSYKNDEFSLFELFDKKVKVRSDRSDKRDAILQNI